jgi:hypothetical protein
MTTHDALPAAVGERWMENPTIRRVDEDVTTLIPHSAGCADFPRPVLHGRALLA